MPTEILEERIFNCCTVCKTPATCASLNTCGLGLDQSQRVSMARPVDEGDSRHHCTAEDPWTPERGKRAYHPDAVELVDFGEVVHYRCPHCGHSWGTELPQ